MVQLGIMLPGTKLLQFMELHTNLQMVVLPLLEIETQRTHQMEVHGQLYRQEHYMEYVKEVEIF